MSFYKKFMDHSRMMRGHIENLEDGRRNCRLDIGNLKDKCEDLEIDLAELQDRINIDWVNLWDRIWTTFKSLQQKQWDIFCKFDIKIRNELAGDDLRLVYPDCMWINYVLKDIEVKDDYKFCVLTYKPKYRSDIDCGYVHKLTLDQYKKMMEKK